ncbi:MAG: hypothetical protein K8T25_04045 [Planctomycetia bacterium]|nr:hypothetical protein [Planctomycetia bacterium]
MRDRKKRQQFLVGMIVFGMGAVLLVGMGLVYVTKQLEILPSPAHRGDYFVRAMMPSVDDGQGADLPTELGEEIKAIPNIANVQTVGFANSKVGDQAVVIVVEEFAGEGGREFDLVKGDPKQVSAQMVAGNVIIGSGLAQRTGLTVGSSIPLKTKDMKDSVSVRVVGITKEYMAGGLTMYMEKSAAQKILGIVCVNAYIINAAPGKVDEVGVVLEALCEKRGLVLQSRKEKILKEKIKFATMAGGAALEVISEAGTGFDDQDVLEKIEHVHGVVAAVPVIRRVSVMFVDQPDSKNAKPAGDATPKAADGAAAAGASKNRRKVLVEVLGIDPAREKAVRDYRLQEGQILVDANFAKALHLNVGDEVRLMTPSRMKPFKFRVVGLIFPLSGSTGNQGAVYMPLEVAQNRFDCKGMVDSIQVATHDEEELKSVEASISRMLPPGLVIRSRASKTQ